MNSSGLLSAAGDPRLSARPLGAEVPRLPHDTDVAGTLASTRRTAGVGRNTPAWVPTAPGTAPQETRPPSIPRRDPGSPWGRGDAEGSGACPRFASE